MCWLYRNCRPTAALQRRPSGWRPGGGTFTILGVPIAQDAAVVDAGFDFRLAPNATLGISYGGQFGAGSLDQSVRGNLSIKF